MRKLPLILLLLLLAALGCGKKEHEILPQGKKVKAQTYVVKAAPVTEYIIAPGRTKATQKITLASKTQGLIKEVFVKEGDRVKRGQLLISVDDADIRRRIKALEEAKKSLEKERQAVKAQLDYAFANYKRFEKLYKEEAATKEEFDRAKSQYLSLLNKLKALQFREKQTEENKKALRAMLRYTRIKAPTDGVIIAKLVDKGTFINPGQPLIKMDSTDTHYEFIANVDEKYASNLSLNQKVPVLLDTDQLLIGIVKSIPPL